MKRVAIVGAGPGGLVAAKTLLHSHPPNTFSVTIFEKTDRIGGLWNVTARPKDGYLPPNLPTNLSRYNVAFSDLSWESMKFGGKPVPMFPKAWQVEGYLEEYSRRYVPSDAFKFRTEVKFAGQIVQDAKTAWKVQYVTSGQEALSEQIFDYLVVATGFFNEPRPIQCKLDGFEQSNSPVKFVHSSKYRSLEDLLPSENTSGKKNILVVGGANSGSDAAAAVAFDLSSRQYSPGEEDELEYQIHHITPRPVYALPLFVPGDVPGSFVPIDMKFYDLSKRPEGPISFAFGKQPPETSRFVHGLVQSWLGTDEHEVGFQVPVSNVAGDLDAPYAAIQEHYAAYARSNLIVPQVGRVTSLQKREGEETLVAHVVTEHGEVAVADIVGVVFANGYTPAPALEFLSEPVKQSLEYDPNDLRLPLLNFDDLISTHPAVPEAGFMGFYEGPFWGVLEAQARILARKWASDNGNRSIGERTEDSKKREHALREVRKAVKSEKARVPQYIFSDYLAALEQTSRDLSLERNENGWGPRDGQVIPARYLDKNTNRHEAQQTMSSMQEMLRQSVEEGRFAPRATFRGMQGNWKIHRRLQSVVVDFPTGTFTGTASFHPRRPTDPEYDFEYLYIEKGTLVTEQGPSMEAHRRYVYRYREDRDRISVWFVKQDGRTVDYLYHELDFQIPEKIKERKEASWVAKGDHLCEKDFYSSVSGFEFNGVALSKFTVKHEVKGPRKDYTSDTRYER